MRISARVGSAIAGVVALVASPLVGVSGVYAVGAPGLAPAAAAAAAGYQPVSPARLLDTRPTGVTVDGVSAKGGAIAAKTPRSFPVAGRGGVPASGVDAVVLNVTAVAPTASTFLSVYPSGQGVPNSSNLNVLKGEVSPNLVVVKLVAGGAVNVYAGAGSVHVLADVAGYFPTGGGYTALSPGRLMDTRASGATVDGQGKATGALAGGAERTLQITGRYGIPSTGVAAVILNVTGVQPTVGTFATVWPTGSTKPSTSNLNLLKGEVKPNLVVAKLGTGGKVSFGIGAGSMHMLADVAGWIPTGSSFTPLTPGRLLDTRATGATVDGVGAKGGAVGAGLFRDVKVTGRHGIPASGVSAVVLNVTGVAPTATTYVTAFPALEPRPNASNLNLVKGEVRPNLVIAKVGSNGSVRLFNNAGSINLIADVAGWFATPGAAPLSVATASLPAGVVAKAYPATTLTAAGGTGPYTWLKRASAAVPVATGLTLSSAGVVGGTPEIDGARYLPVRVTDSKGATADKDIPVSITFQTTAITTTSLPAATCNTAYSAQLAGTGSFFPDNWFLKAGSVLPTGLTMSDTGRISGTPTANTSTPFTIQLVDAKGGVKEKTLTITVTGCVAGPVVTTTSLASGTVGTAYSQTLGASGGTAPYTWSLASGTLPTGLALTAASGAITGTPTGPVGTTSFTVRATDSSAPTKKTADKLLSITLAAPPPVNITTTSLPGGRVGTAYSQTLGATGGTTPYVWALSLGSLPAGLSLSSGGVLSGTPTTVGTSTFTVKVTAGATNDSQQLSIVISPPPLAITTSSLPNAQLNSSYSAPITATGGVPPYTWTLSAGTLPAGLTLTAGGSITGTPTAAGTSSFTVQVKDNAAAPTTVTKALSLTVVVPPVVISPSTLPEGTVGVDYGQGIFASGGASSDCTITVSAGSIPAGLTLQAEGFGDYTLGGAPNVAGTHSFTLQANCGGVTGTRAYSLVIKPAPLAITTTSLPTVLIGDTYSGGLSAQGGTGPYTWSITSGALPAGLTLATNGQITGTAPAVFGEATATFRATDATSATVSKALTIYVNEFDGEITFLNGEVGVPYTSTVESSFFGGNPPYSFTSTGTKPAGLTLSTSGILSGTPTAAGTYTFAAQATDADGLRDKNGVTVVIHPTGPALSITTASLPPGQVDKYYFPTLVAAGGYTPYSWAVTGGTPPPGLRVTDFGCGGGCWSFEGVPEEAGTYTFSLTVTDDGQVKTTKAYTVTIAPAPLVITTTSLPMGAVGAAYSSALKASGGISPYAWSLTTGTMPAGLSLSPSGLITGSPTAAATTSLSLKVTDSAAATANVTLNLVVGTPTTASTVSAGAAHTCAVAAGKVRCWGSGFNGELGNGFADEYATTPVEVSGLTTATKVAAGSGFSCAVLSDGRVACWGANYRGQLGNGSTQAAGVPVFTGITNAAAVTAGEDHACALLSTGGVSCWGWNSSGQIGTGTASSTAVTVPTAVTGLTGATSVSAGGAHTCAVVAGGAVRCWGSNSSGELGNGTTTPSATPVTALASGASQVSAGTASSCARLTTGAVSCWGDYPFQPTPMQVAGVSGATSVDVGAYFACAQTGTTVTCWGENYSGQLGNGTITTAVDPVTVSGVSGTLAGALTAGDQHACVILTGGSIRCWGDNTSGQIGNGREAWSAVPVQVSGVTSGATSVAPGYDHTCAALSGAVKCWGANDVGQLGKGTEGDPQPLPVAAAVLTSGVAQVGSGYRYSCARRAAGTVACWGDGFSGQLGDGNFGTSSTPVDVSGVTGAQGISLGMMHACALVTGGAVSCWGANYTGQLGDGTTESLGTPVTVTGVSGATSIAAGSQHSCAVVSGGVRCWGDNSNGQVNGTPSNDAVLTPVTVPGLTGVASVTTGGGFSCAVLTAGGIKCWGLNASGELGMGDTLDHTGLVSVLGVTTATQVSARGSSACARLSTGTALCWGSGEYGQLGDGGQQSHAKPRAVSGLTNAVEVQMGDVGACARLSTGALQCWGDGQAGNLGDGSAGLYATQQRVVGF